MDNSYEYTFQLLKYLLWVFIWGSSYYKGPHADRPDFFPGLSLIISFTFLRRQDYDHNCITPVMCSLQVEHIKQSHGNAEVNKAFMNRKASKLWKLRVYCNLQITIHNSQGFEEIPQAVIYECEFMNAPSHSSAEPKLYEIASALGSLLLQRELQPQVKGRSAWATSQLSETQF